MNHPWTFGPLQFVKDAPAALESASKWVVLCDHNTRTHCLPRLLDALAPLQKEVFTLSIPPGEAAKSLEQAAEVWAQMQRVGVERSDVVFCLGGGVVTDLGGFCASVFMRGIPFIHVPTTLMGMADAALGGKTGVNFQAHKNRLGLFTAPERVYLDPNFLATLPARELVNGAAEVLKQGLLSGGFLYEKLLEWRDQDLPLHQNWNISDRSQVIQAAAEFKMGVVRADEREKGQRAILNFGHTVGHALESCFMGRAKGAATGSGNAAEHSAADPGLVDSGAVDSGAQAAASPESGLLHGEAVLLGMMAETLLSHEYAGLASKEYARIMDLLDWAAQELDPGLPHKKAFMEFLLGDKKKQRSQLRLALISALGKPQFPVVLTPEQVWEAVEEVLGE